MITPSLEIREEAARLFVEAWERSDVLSEAEDRGVAGDALEDLEDRCAEAWQSYSDFCDWHEIELLTDASGLFLRCAKTQIPLVDTDEVIEGEGDELIRVEREYAA